jgi:hypothetical protein
MVVRCAAHCVRLVTVGGECVEHVRDDVHHALVVEGRHGHSVPVEGAFHRLVRGEFIVVYWCAQHIQRVLNLRDHLAPQYDTI